MTEADIIWKPDIGLRHERVNSPSLTDRVSKREMQIYLSIYIFHSKLSNFVSACWNSNLSNLLIQINGI